MNSYGSATNDQFSVTNNSSVAKTRMVYLDNLKALMIIFVILIHVAVTYSGIGMWYYTEPKNLGEGTFNFFILFQTFNQAYFMSLFFMIAAYFIPPSLAKKGMLKFIADRLLRLIVPTLIFMFIITPILLKMMHPEVGMLDIYHQGIVGFKFISWMGPMWFALVLFTFSLIYSIVDRLVIKHFSNISFVLGAKSISILIMIIIAMAFSIRLVYPIGTEVENLQFCFFGAYIVMFIFGIIAYKNNLFEKIDYQQAKGWFIAAFAFGVPLWVLVTYFGVDKEKIQPAIFGGWHWLAFGYAFWESFFCVAIIIGLIGMFKRYFNTQNSLQRFLSDNAFVVYVFHPLVVVGVSILLKDVNLPPIIKFIMVSSIVTPVIFVVASLIRKINILRKIFS